MVVCDRFLDSTRAYQGAGGGAPGDLIETLERRTLDGAWPDLTLVFDLPVAAGLARAVARSGAEARFEGKGPAFHERLRAGYLDIARREPGRCAVVDASGGVDQVAETVWSLVSQRMADA